MTGYVYDGAGRLQTLTYNPLGGQGRRRNSGRGIRPR